MVAAVQASKPRLTASSQPGPYSYSRNPMYLAHLIYLLGIEFGLRSWLGAVIKTGAALWFAVESSAMNRT
jgi:protein-S-isoprenylcysteine O-methyltransferase Ste14